MQRNQLLFFSAFLLSAFGYEFIYFIMTVHIYDLSKSALNVGIFTTLTFIPKLLSSFMGGIADKVGKEKSFALSAILTGILMLIMANASDMTVIYIIWFGASIFFTVIMNARGTLMAEVVSSDHYAFGNAVVLSLLNGAKLLGPHTRHIAIPPNISSICLYTVLLNVSTIHYEFVGNCRSIPYVISSDNRFTCFMNIS